MRYKRLGLLFFYLFTVSPIATACNIIAINNQNFSLVTDQNNINKYYLADITVNCNRPYQLGIDAGMHIQAGSRQLAHTEGKFIAYALYQGASTNEWGSQGLAGANIYPQPAVVSSGASHVTHRIYATAATRDKTLSGIYVDTVNVTLTDASGYAIATPSMLNFNLELATSCTLDTRNFSSFGSYPLGSAAITNIALGSIAVTCPSAVAYKIGIDKGQNLSAGHRRMTSDGSQFITYVLKYNGTEWGDAGLTDLAPAYVETFPAPAVADIGTGSPQNFAIDGDAAIDKATSTGIYTDTLNVTLTW